MAKKQILGKIKNQVDGLIGNRIVIRSFDNRKRIIENSGILEETYPNVFTVNLEIEKGSIRVAYSYTDILTESIEIINLSNNS